MTEYGLIAMIWIIYAFVLLILPLLVLCLVGHKRQRRKIAVWLSLAVLCAQICMTVLLCIQPPIINLNEQGLDSASENIIRYVVMGGTTTYFPCFRLRLL